MDQFASLGGPANPLGAPATPKRPHTDVQAMPGTPDAQIHVSRSSFDIGEQIKKLQASLAQQDHSAALWDMAAGLVKIQDRRRVWTSRAWIS